MAVNYALSFFGPLRLNNGTEVPADSRYWRRRSKLIEMAGQSWDQKIPLPKLSLPLALSLVFALATMCFWGSRNGEFVFDDTEAIMTNKDLRPETPVWKTFQNDFWGKNITKKDSHKSYRPLTVLTFRLNYWLSSGLHPFGFHLTNILLHAAVSMFLLYFVGQLLSKACWDTTARHQRPWSQFAYPKASLLTALLFATHPIHSESVAAVVGRADLLCALFYMSAILLYMSACHPDGQVSQPGTRHSICRLILSVAVCGLAMLFKEQGITAMGVCSIYDVVCVCRVDLSRVVSLRGGGRKGWHREPWFRSLLARQTLLCALTSLLLLCRWLVMGFAPPAFQLMDNPASFSNSTLTRTLSYNYVYALNGWLLLNPWWLCFDWAMGCIPLIESLSDVRLLAVMAFWTIMAALFYHSLTLPPSSPPTTTPSTRIMITMSLALLVIPFLPASNLFFRVGFVLAERQLYLPSIGYCLLLTLATNRLAHNPKYRKTLGVILVALLALFVARSWTRSLEWQSGKMLYRAGLKVCPLNAKVHYNIAKDSADNDNNIELSIQEYREAIRLYPFYDQALNNLANILKDMNHNEEAENLLERAVSARPEFAAAWMNLGIVQTALKKYDQAEQSYVTALRYRKNYPDCFFNMGNLFLDRDEKLGAIEAWRNATFLNPLHAGAWNNILLLCDNLGQYDLAIKAGMHAIEKGVEDAPLYFSLANVYGKNENYQEAEKYYLDAIRLKPGQANYYGNLGVVYHRWKRYEQAEHYYHQSLQLDPDNHNVQSNYKKLLKAMKKNNAD